MVRRMSYRSGRCICWLLPPCVRRLYCLLCPPSPGFSLSLSLSNLARVFLVGPPISNYSGGGQGRATNPPSTEPDGGEKGGSGMNWGSLRKKARERKKKKKEKDDGFAQSGQQIGR
ncbi:hypothetical protein F5Y14DRAFT_404789 [Nemania sp. NC0429]|nr:hypothetical protein F5Y14DRAFT_404789 [Nemania sp. NC0429]